MKRLFLMILAILMPVSSLLPTATFAAFNPHYLLSDDELTDTFSMTEKDIQTFLERGSLGAYEGPDVYGEQSTAAEIIWNAAYTFGLSPQFLLVLLQREQSLVEDDAPSEDQLAWAMGYAVCDDCQKDDPLIQKFRGFGNQVYYAAKRIRESYLTDLAGNGATLSGVGPGIETIIDDIPVIPQSAATAVLYTYTPHLHGNENFVKIWQRWFTRDYPSGSLLQDSESGGIWLIQYGKRRPITSRTAFLTRFNENTVIPVKLTTLEAYPIGTPISLPNYSLLRSPRGTVYLLVDDAIRGFASGEAFRSLGFNTEEVIDVSFEDLAAYQEGAPITTESTAPQGRLAQDTATGGIFYLEEGVKHPFMSREILDNRFKGWRIHATDPVELAAMPSGDAVKFQDGALIGVIGSPDVFVVSEGKRLPIINGETFETFGWQWDNIIWSNERSVLLHDLGEPIRMEIEEELVEDEDLTLSSTP